MDLTLTCIGFVFMIIGVLGSFLPILPGPSISWLGLLLLSLTKTVPNNYWMLGITLLITIAISILDYIIPARGTKKFGGSKYGVWGTNIGLIAGIVTPIPLGFIIGPFVGAFLGELYHNSKDQKRALKAATGSFIGFLTSTFLKFIVCIGLLGYYLLLTWEYKSKLF